MIKIFDDLIPYSYLEDIQNYFLNGNAPWTFMPSMTYGEEEGDMESFGLSISICNHGRFEQTYQATLLKGLLYTILEQTGQKEIFRSRIDMTLYNPDGYRHEVHTDLPDNSPSRQQRYTVTPNPATADADDDFGFNETTAFFEDAKNFDEKSGTDK